MRGAERISKVEALVVKLQQHVENLSRHDRGSYDRGSSSRTRSPSDNGWNGGFGTLRSYLDDEDEPPRTPNNIGSLRGRGQGSPVDGPSTTDFMSEIDLIKSKLEQLS